jgi:hypothetical protein
LEHRPVDDARPWIYHPSVHHACLRSHGLLKLAKCRPYRNEQLGNEELETTEAMHLVLIFEDDHGTLNILRMLFDLRRLLRC